MAKDIPPIPGTVPADLQRPLQRMREELQRLLGYRGDERALTTANAASLGYLFAGTGGTTGTGGGSAEEPDLTAPPTPTFGDGDAVGGLTNVLLSWSGVTYPQGHGNLQTVIYGVKRDTSDPDIPTFPGDSAIVATAPHPLTIYAIPSEPNTRWHLWLKFESVDGVRSVVPAGGANGVVAVTGQDISQLLQILTNSITTSELAAALAARINLIDAGAGVAGSVDARILAETTARIDAVTDEANARILAIDNEVDARLLAENGLQSQIDLLSGSVGGDLTAFFNALLSETSSRVEADLSAANAITLANATIADTAFGLETEQGVRELANAILAANAATTVTGANNTASGLTVEQQIRAAADGAVASQAASLAVTAGDNAAAVRDEQIARATADDAQASSTVSLAAAGANTAAALQVEQTARATADSAQATSTTIVGAAVAGAAAAIKVEQDARAGADLAAASQIASLSASVASANAAIVFEQDVRASADTATSSQVMALAASVTSSDGISAAAIVVEQQVRATADATLAAQQSTLSAATSDNLASVIIEQDARATADSAAAAQSAVLGATAAAALAGLVVEQETRANSVEAVASQSTALTANIEQAGAAIKAEQLVRAAADDVVASQFGTVGASVGANTAAIQTEQTVRAGVDASAATLIENALVSAGSNMAGILTEQQIRAGADTAVAEQIHSLTAAVANANAAITTEQDVRAGADSASSALLTSIAASIGSSDGLTSAGLVIEQLARVAADEAQASQTELLRSETGGNLAALSAEQVARATADTVTAAQNLFLGANAANALAGLAAEQLVRASAVAALSSQDLALTAGVAQASSALTVEQLARSTGDATTASQITILGAKIDDNAGASTAAIEVEQDVRAAADSAAASYATTLAAANGSNAASLSTEQAVRSAADVSAAAQSAALAAATATAAAAISTEQAARAADGSASASQSALLSAAVDENRAALLIEQVSRASADSSTVGLIGTLTASSGANTAAINTEQLVRASETGPLLASYTVKMDLNGYVTGYGLQSSLSSGGAPTSTFLVSVDKFAVMTPPSSVANWSGFTTYALGDIRGVAGNTDKVLVCKQAGFSGSGGSPPAIAGAIGTILTDNGVKWQIASRVPFSVLTVPTTVNGISVPAGVYIDGAYVLSATVGNAQIGNLAVDNAKIADVAVAKLLGGNLSVGGYIESADYTSGPGGTGYRIDRDSVVLPATAIRGQLTASQINGNGLSINAIDGTPILSAGVPLPAAYVTEANFQAERLWNFNGGVEGFTNGNNTSLSSPSTYMTVAATGSDPYFFSPTFSVYGPAFNKVRARIMRTAGAGWDGSIFYSTGAHGHDGGFYKNVPVFPAANNEWVVIEWDMIDLTAGGSDWIASNITQIRLDLGTSAADTFLVDWIAIGGLSPASYGAEFGRNVFGQITAATASTFIANAAIGTAQIGNAQITNALIDRASVNRLQVVTADIGDLQVSSLKIGANAVTVPLAGQAISVAPSTTEATVLNLGTMNTSVNGASSPLYLHIAFDGSVQASSTGGGLTTVTYRIKLNGFTVATFEFHATVPSQLRTHIKSEPVYIASPPNNDFTLTVTGQISSLAGGAFANTTITLFALGTKR